MADLLSFPPRGRQHLVLRVDAGLRGGELRRPLGGVFAARTNEYGRKMNGELSGLRTPPVPPTMGGSANVPCADGSYKETADGQDAQRRGERDAHGRDGGTRSTRRPSGMRRSAKRWWAPFLFDAGKLLSGGVPGGRTGKGTSPVLSSPVTSEPETRSSVLLTIADSGLSSLWLSGVWLPSWLLGRWAEQPPARCVFVVLCAPFLPSSVPPRQRA